MLRDRIVCGIRDEQARRHMLSQQKLSLAEVEAFSQAAEAAETNVRAMQERSFNDDGAANFVQKHRRNPQKSGRGHGSMTESTQCGRCGSNHGSEVCRHKKATCHKCGMKGHLARMCSSGRTNRSGTYAVKELDGSDGSSEDILYALEAHNNSRNLSARPFERDFIWEGRNLRMLVDTGSTISVIPRRVFDNNREWWPPLEKTSLRLTCFLGPLPVLGRVAMKVECSNTQVDSSLVVLDCNGPLLCGQNTIQAFRKAGLALLEECASQNIHVVHGDATTAKLLTEFPEVFEHSLGCCVAVVILLLFMVNILGAKTAMLITTVWPMLGSIRAIDRADVLALQKWTAYWIMYALVNVFLNFLFVAVHRYFKRIYLIKLLLLAWCAAPMQNNGSNIIFQKVFAGKIFKEGPMVPGGNGAPAAAPMPPPAAGGKKESPDTSRKMRK
ncbi:hypothetical protein V5799_006589 [Amblyomma americanum]|uniref:CCHC-type domain-containing protein n=2 Tax=Amblyomma americanum TaxID=6943 RepID=A0AAQ4DVZ0_AMBAM